MKNTTPTLTFLATCALTMTAVAGTWYVAPAPTGDDSKGGTAAEPFATIGHAIVAAAEGDEIRIQAGTYLENVRNDSAASGKNGLRFRGGYAADWSRDLKTQKTVVKAADATKTVFYVNTKTNLLNGLTLTGGKYGFECDLADNGKYQYLYQCVVSNNTDAGVWAIKSCRVAAASSLFRKNVIGVRGGQVNGQPLSFYNCTFVGHSNAALFHGDEYGREIYAYNCAFDDNTYHLWHNYTYDHEIAATDCVFGSVRSGGAYADGKCQQWGGAQDTFYGNTMYRPAGLNADYTLSDASYCLKRGSDQSANAVLPYDEDLVGEAWGSEWDMGCFKSSAPLVALPNNAHVYASPAGDDANSGLDAEHPKKTILAGLNELGEYGVLHLANGTYPEGYTGLIHRPGIQVIGESREGTIVKGKNSSSNATRGPFYVNAHSVVISNMTLVGGTGGVMFAPPPACSNSVVSHCTVSNAYFGIRSRCRNARSPGCFIRLSKCLFEKNTYAGTYLQSAVVMDNCLVVSNASDGVNWIVWESQGGADSAIVNCTMIGNGGCGFKCNWDSAERCRLFNCVIADNGDWGVYRDGQRSYHRYNEVYNCVFKGNKSGTVSEGYVGTAGIYNLMEVADLGFMTKSGCEYIPDRGSPLVKAGVTNQYFSAELIATDIADRPRKNLKKPDVGCYQHTYANGLSLLVR